MFGVSLFDARSSIFDVRFLCFWEVKKKVAEKQFSENCEKLFFVRR